MPIARMPGSPWFVLALTLTACALRDDPAGVPVVERGLSTLDDGPLTTCGPDGVCNLEFCDFDDDPDCTEEDCSDNGACNVHCAFDPDCEPDAPACERDVPWSTHGDSSSCDSSFAVRSDSDDELVIARAFIEAKWPNWAAAKDLDYDEDNDEVNEANESCWRNGHEHANLVGIGASLTRGECSDPFWDDIHGVEGDYLQPSLLMFEKNGNFASDEGRTDWEVIGAGYHFDYDPCERPCMPHVPDWRWVIHEAGWHRTGDGGFDCIEQRDVDSGTGIVITDQCTRIDKEDFHRAGKTSAAKHERLWTLHVWFDPDGSGVAISKSDPWCRWMDDGDENIVGVDCEETDAFYLQTDECACG